MAKDLPLGSLYAVLERLWRVEGYEVLQGDLVLKEASISLSMILQEQLFRWSHY